MNIDSMIQGNPQALVTSYNGVLVADSLEVADRFGKRHTHVLRSIDDLINQLESQSTQNWADYFIPDDYQDNKNRTQRRFKLTRDGFSLLVMGFTGPAALHWKLLYIEAFNKMEQALRSNVDIRQLVTQITTDVLRTVLPDIRQAVEPPPEIEDGRVHNSRRLDFLYGNDEALPNFLTVYDILLKRRTVPEMIWAFKTGGNLISASRERSIEEMYNTVKLINRETGKTAIKVNAKNKALYGNTQYYEEISDKDKNLSKMAKQKLKSLSKITSTMSMSGLNSDGAMGQFFVGDPIYVEEKNTGMVGGYWVRNVSHTFLADDAIQLDFDLTATEDIPEIQYDNSKK